MKIYVYIFLIINIDYTLYSLFRDILINRFHWLHIRTQFSIFQFFKTATGGLLLVDNNTSQLHDYTSLCYMCPCPHPTVRWPPSAGWFLPADPKQTVKLPPQQGTTQHTAPHRTALRCTALHCTARHCTMGQYKINRIESFFVIEIGKIKVEQTLHNIRLF